MPQRNDRIMTCEEIEDEDDNMLVKLDWPRLQEEFFTYLDNHTRDIQGIVYHHLPLPLYQKQCTVADRSEWRWGDFNVCIPISVGKWRTERLLLRCPFPHKLGGLRNTDSMDEKIRCEAATFAWISKKCEHVPVPRLWGFGLPSGLCVRRLHIASILADNSSSSRLLPVPRGIYEPQYTCSEFGPGYVESRDGVLSFLTRASFH